MVPGTGESNPSSLKLFEPCADGCRLVATGAVYFVIEVHRVPSSIGAWWSVRSQKW